MIKKAALSFKLRGFVITVYSPQQVMKFKIILGKNLIRVIPLLKREKTKALMANMATSTELLFSHVLIWTIYVNKL